MAEVAIVLGSKSDLAQAEKAHAALARLGITSTVQVASAHRNPERLDAIIRDSDARIFIAMAGMAAALPGVIASRTTRPVIGVPLSGGVAMDSLLSIVQMPRGVPVATVAVDGAENAALLAAEILALSNPKIETELARYRQAWKEEPAEAPKHEGH